MVPMNYLRVKCTRVVEDFSGRLQEKTLLYLRVNQVHAFLSHSSLLTRASGMNFIRILQTDNEYLSFILY